MKSPFSAITTPTEGFINSAPILLTLLIMYQGLFSGNAIAIPRKLKVMFDNRVFRYISLLLIAYSATKDIEYSIISTYLFLGILYLIKTPKERKETGFI